MTPAPKRWLRDWLHGAPWGLVEKTNPRATPQSVKRWAIAGAIGAAIYGASWSYFTGRWVLLLAMPLFAVGGAFIGALVDYQLDDGDD